MKKINRKKLGNMRDIFKDALEAKNQSDILIKKRKRVKSNLSE